MSTSEPTQEVRFGCYTRLHSDFSETVRDAVLIEKSGFDSMWAGDHLMSPNPDQTYSDVFCLLSAVSMKTENLLLGTCATDPYRRHPAVLAHAAATVDQISRGRLILGIGAGEAMNLIPFGIPFDRPVPRLRETIVTMRKLWTEEHPIRFRGRYFHLDNARLQLKCFRKPHVPIYVAANSPHSRELAADMGDGWITLLSTPDLIRKDLKELRSRAKRKHGRIQDFDVVYLANIAISRNFDEAKRIALQTTRMDLLCWPSQLERLGCSATRDYDWLRLSDMKSGGIASEISANVNRVPARIAEKVSIFGTWNDCIEKISSYVNAGVCHFLFSIRSDRAEFYDLFSKHVIPYFK